MLKSQNDDIYIDQETYFDVKHTFEKLKVFFDVMKKYGWVSSFKTCIFNDLYCNENFYHLKMLWDKSFLTCEDVVIKAIFFSLTNWMPVILF